MEKKRGPYLILPDKQESLPTFLAKSEARS